MKTRPAVALTALLLVAAACTDAASADTTAATTTSSTTTTTTLIPTTNSSTTTSEATTTTTTTAPTTTTTVAATTTTTDPPADADPDLVPWAGLFRQPTSFTGFLDFQANGVIRAGTSFDDLNITGRWDYDETEEQFIFADFDFGEGCNGAEGRYARERARGGGRRILLVDDPCEERVDFITQPGSPCECFVYLEVELPGEDE